MKKSILNLVAIVAVSSLALVSCDKTKKAVEEVKDNTEATVQESTEAVSDQLDTLQAEVDTLQAEVTEATGGEAK